MGTLNISPFFLLPTIFLLLSSQIDSKTFWADIQALKELKSAINTDSITAGSCLSSWDFTMDPCDSLFSEHFTCGFRCDKVVDGASRVTEVTFDQAGYTGLLTPLNLQYLETLDLNGNFLSGKIPDSLSNLTRLRILNLRDNSFSGEIPSSLGFLSSLEELLLADNNLQGEIPASFNNLASLNKLELQSNGLSGEFPDLGMLKNLNYLDASNNVLSGQVPATLPNSLIAVIMRNNSLEGTIPGSVSNMGYLQVLDLSYNKLSGSVPSLVFTHPTLQQLTLSFNKFTSVQAPPSFPTQSELIALSLDNNEIKGLLPAFIATMPKLSALSLENNMFTGMIPTQYALKTVVPVPGTAQFARLLLGGNYLFGPIPGPLMELKPDTVNVSLVYNCLYRCPMSFFFCQGGDQKSVAECKRFGHSIP